jgi:hypothetical protein
MDTTGIDESTLGAYYYSCNEVSVYCPVEATTLGYFPNRGINSFFAAAFGLVGLTALVLGVWKRTWSFTVFLTFGCMLELAGTCWSFLLSLKIYWSHRHHE